MQFFLSFLLSAQLFLGIANAGWREECGFGGNAQFNIINAVPYLSTLCPSPTGRQICTMLDLSYCLMNSLGHLTATIKYVSRNSGAFSHASPSCFSGSHSSSKY
ncbi:hypothetical protein F5Y12DRAFT_37993 [Xylaria sp. FL1777]|nr:hypothetical protein F5Y12DRAFT_37993 [Xylaria sp. FL1777]